MKHKPLSDKRLRIHVKRVVRLINGGYCLNTALTKVSRRHRFQPKPGKTGKFIQATFDQVETAIIHRLRLRLKQNTRRTS